MRVICLVPSLTETLIGCGANVVGRTRFCIHPKDKVESIVKVGGTKGVDWEKCAALKPDLVIFDREENKKTMAEACPYPWTVTHITSVDTIGDELIKLAERLNNQPLKGLGDDWKKLAELPNKSFSGWNNLPGLLELLNNDQEHYKRLEYIIWREPWMAVGQNTFIYSMLQKFGFGDFVIPHAEPYPTLSESDMSRTDTFYLFSSEPYPFERHQQQLVNQGFNGSIVDGEVFSWFGIRSYQSLSRYLLK